MLYKLVTLLLFVLLGTVAVAEAQVKCRDAQGIVHYAGTVDQLPASCRAQVESPSNLPPVTATNPGVSDRYLRQRALEDAQQRQAESEVRFNQTAAACAQRSGVEIIFKGGTRINILGTAAERFAFDKCMSQSGQHTESSKWANDDGY